MNVESTLSPFETAKSKFVSTLESHYKDSYWNLIHNPKKMARVMNQIKNDYFQGPYEVLNEAGKEQLIVKRKCSDKRIVKVLSVEELFTVLYDLHIKNDHRVMDLRPELKNYLVPDVFLYYLGKCCSQCNKDDQHTSQVREIVKDVRLVYIVPVNRVTEEEFFPYMLIYIDMATDFTVLRLIEQREALEIAIELMKIVTQFGVPQKIVLYGCNIKFNEIIIKRFEELCPKLKVVFETKEMNYKRPAKVVCKLINMFNNIPQGTSWLKELPYLQKKLNSLECLETDPNKKESPHQKFFGRLLKDNFRNYDLNKDNNKTVTKMVKSGFAENNNEESLNLIDDTPEIEDSTDVESDTVAQDITDTKLEVDGTKSINNNQDLCIIDTITIDDDDLSMETTQTENLETENVCEITDQRTLSGYKNQATEIIEPQQETSNIVESLDNLNDMEVIIDEIDIKEEPLVCNNMENIEFEEVNDPNAALLGLTEEEANVNSDINKMTNQKVCLKVEKEKGITDEVEMTEVKRDIIDQELIDEVDEELKLLSELEKYNQETDTDYQSD